MRRARERREPSNRHTRTCNACFLLTASISLVFNCTRRFSFATSFFLVSSSSARSCRDCRCDEDNDVDRRAFHTNESSVTHVHEIECHTQSQRETHLHGQFTSIIASLSDFIEQRLHRSRSTSRLGHSNASRPRILVARIRRDRGRRRGRETRRRRDGVRGASATGSRLPELNVLGRHLLEAHAQCLYATLVLLFHVLQLKLVEFGRGELFCEMRDLILTLRYES